MSQVATSARSLPRWLGTAVTLVVLVGIIGVAIVFRQAWLPRLSALVNPAPPAAEGEGHEDHHDHAGHDHAGHDDANSIELSEQARKNIGLTVGKVTLQSFTRTITLPGMVVERPGRSTIEATTPMTGIVTRIYPIQGEAVEPGQVLFELRLTHEEIVQAQADLLRTAEELDVLAREVARLERVTVDGAIAGKTLLERKYEQQKMEAISRSQQQALRLHGLTDEQVDGILKDRSLLQQVTIRVPDGEMSAGQGAERYQVQELKVSPGQHVEAGASLAVLANYGELFIEGSAFERDAAEIQRAASSGWAISALLDSRDAETPRLDDLRILYLASKVDPDTRSLHFYVVLPNEVEREATRAEERHFLTWRYRPGQRVQLLVPVETWADRIVLPIDAVALDGPETYVFTPNGNHFDRRPVHVEYRDSQWAVIANDGSLFPGESVALSGAQQLQLAVEGKSGGAIDPHAGHNH